MRLPTGNWPVILADPPWAFQTYGGASVPARGVQPYHTMTLDDIKAVPVADVAGKDCMLFMWILDSMLPQALEVGAAWGFPKYIKVGFNWCKPDMGMGYWSRNDTELCLMFSRGKPKRLNADVRQRIGAPAGKHSEKPIDTYTKIERLIAGPYLELFAREGACAYKDRGYREGWTPWGLEAPGLTNRLARLEAALDTLTEMLG